MEACISGPILITKGSLIITIGIYTFIQLATTVPIPIYGLTISVFLYLQRICDCERLQRRLNLLLGFIQLGGSPRIGVAANLED